MISNALLLDSLKPEKPEPLQELLLQAFPTSGYKRARLALEMVFEYRAVFVSLLSYKTEQP